MPTFKYNDGSTHEFAEFKVDKTKVMQITLPSAGRKRNGWSVAQIYLSDVDFEAQKAAYRGGTKATDANKIRAGVLVRDTNHPFPKGVYIPFKLANWGSIQHALDEMAGDFIFNEEIKNEK